MTILLSYFILRTSFCLDTGHLVVGQLGTFVPIVICQVGGEATECRSQQGEKNWYKMSGI